MQTVNTIATLQAVLKNWRLAGERIAFVPTMGNLHAGHLQLVEAAQAKADRVVVSIFINPTQFGAGEDFATYPRTEQEDQLKLAAINTDLLFLPNVSEMYQPTAQTVVSVLGLSEQYCGASRAGHFNGVATIVCKLFNIVQPDLAVFGEKDFQQLAIIRTLVRDLNMAVAIDSVATIRADSGLALSSRNSYLSDTELTVAPLLYQALCRARTAILAGQTTYQDIEQQASAFLQQAGFIPDYFNVCRQQDLQAATADDKKLVILAAAKLGKTRLIDNICLDTMPQNRG